jgi:putative peptidoglycan lipid II flippase
MPETSPSSATQPADRVAPAAAPAATPAQPAASKGGALRSTLLVSAMTLASRLLGLVREQLFAALLGAGFFADAFVVAFRIPNLLRDLFAEGALSAAFVPTFARVEKEQGKDAAHAVANRVAGAILLILGALTLLGIAFARPLVWAMAAGFEREPGKLELTAQLAQIMMPFLPIVSLAALTMGMLNARGHFSRPAIAPALFNLAAIGVGAGLKLAGASPQVSVIGWSLGTLAGGALQFGVQLPELFKDGYRFLPRIRGLWRDESLRRIARLMAPATLGLAATQVNIFVNTQFASGEPGANAWLNYAFRLMYLPIGIFGVAIATVTASSLARKAAEKDLVGMKAGLAQGLRHVAFLTVPSTVGLVVLAEPIIGLIYQHGRFHASDTHATALALMGYAVGLYAYSGVKVAAPAFYALDRTRVPLIASASAVAVNLALNLAAHRWLGYQGLALGTSLGALANLLILTWSFRQLTRSVEGPRGLFWQLARVVVASALMGLVVWGALRGLDTVLEARGIGIEQFWPRLLRAVGGVALGGVAYVGACKLLRIGEMDEVFAALKRRRRR